MHEFCPGLHRQRWRQGTLRSIRHCSLPLSSLEFPPKGWICSSPVQHCVYFTHSTLAREFLITMRRPTGALPRRTADPFITFQLHCGSSVLIYIIEWWPRWMNKYGSFKDSLKILVPNFNCDTKYEIFPEL